MTLAAGTKLGPYEILAPLGAGGMGEVFRATDERLGREVAVKVLPAQVAADPDRLRRFEQEARLAGALNHPNVLTVHDLGARDGAPYLVLELLEGRTLRELAAAGPLAPRRVAEIGAQVARGLAAAHAKGIVHRDLKPENLFETRDGTVKILDFGLARLAPPTEQVLTGAPTFAALTAPGAVLGTVGYMAPEQIRGEPADARSDVFALGCVLYELLSGQRAFKGSSAVATLHAILESDPPPLDEVRQGLPPSFGRVVERCLAKEPAQRFQSAADLGFALASLATGSGETAARAAFARRGLPRLLRRSAWGAAAATALVLAFWAGTRKSAPSGVPRVTVERITFQRGIVLGSRFTGDGENVVYSASWEGRPTEVFLTRVGSAEARPLGFPGSVVTSVSRNGELALLRRPGLGRATRVPGILSRVFLTGGTPRDVASDVMAADWSPDGNDLAIVRRRPAATIEYPIGNVALEKQSIALRFIRAAPDGERFALVGSNTQGSGGSILVSDRKGSRRVWSTGWQNIEGIAWHPSGREIWLSGTAADRTSGLFAVGPDDKPRLLWPIPDVATLSDVRADGTVLLQRTEYRNSLLFAREGDAEERDLSHLGGSVPGGLTPDGRSLLLTDGGHGGDTDLVFVRATDGAPPIRLAAGRGLALDPEGRTAAVLEFSTPAKLLLVPVGPGTSRTVETGDVTPDGAAFLPPDGRRLFVTGVRPDGSRAFLMASTAGGPSTTVRAPVRGRVLFDVTGQRWVAGDGSGRLSTGNLDGTEKRDLAGLEPGEALLQWSADGRFVYVMRAGEPPVQVSRIDLATGAREAWKKLPAERSPEIYRVESIQIARDGRSWVTEVRRATKSDVIVVRGLR